MQRPFTIFISGAQGTGKSTLTKALTCRGEMRLQISPQMREIVGAAFPDTTLNDLSPTETFSAFMIRALGRYETACDEKICVNDGSLLNDAAYLRGRLEVGAFGAASRVTDLSFKRLVDLFERHVHRSFSMMTNYLLFHIEPELPLESDGYRPQSKEFRSFVNRYLLESYGELGLNFVLVSGSTAERIKLIEKVLIENDFL